MHCSVAQAGVVLGCFVTAVCMISIVCAGCMWAANRPVLAHVSVQAFTKTSGTACGRRFRFASGSATVAHAKAKEAEAVRAKAAHQAACVKGLDLLQLLGVDTNNKEADNTQYSETLRAAEVAQMNARTGGPPSHLQPGPLNEDSTGVDRKHLEEAPAKGAPTVHPGARIIHCHTVWMAWQNVALT